MENKSKQESYVYKINKVYLVVADSVSEAEAIFKKHYPTSTVDELKKTGKVLL